MIGLSSGEILKNVDKGDDTITGFGLTNPLRSQLGMSFSSFFMTRVSMT